MQAIAAALAPWVEWLLPRQIFSSLILFPLVCLCSLSLFTLLIVLFKLTLNEFLVDFERFAKLLTLIRRVHRLVRTVEHFPIAPCKNAPIAKARRAGPL